jgi:hypothetical protein
MDAPHPRDSRTSGPAISLQRQGLPALRKLWQEAVADDSEGLDPDAVFEQLKSKYDSLAKAAER